MSNDSFHHREAQTALTQTDKFNFWGAHDPIAKYAPLSLLIQPDAANGALRPVYLYGTPQALSGAGAINVTAYKTDWTTAAGAAAGTLADGTIIGQMKLIQMVVDGGGVGTLTPANFASTSIAFADAGDCALLQWDGSNWQVVDLFNRADGATAPAVT